MYAWIFRKSAYWLFAAAKESFHYPSLHSTALTRCAFTVVPHDLLRVAEVSLVVVRVHSHYGKLLVHVGLVGIEVDEHVVQRLKPHRARVHHAADEPGGGARLLEGHQRPRGDHWDDVTEDGGKERGWGNQSDHNLRFLRALCDARHPVC